LNYWIGIDTGGTFTDCVIMDEKGTLYSNKSPSTPNDLSIGVVNAIKATAESMNIKLKKCATTCTYNCPCEHYGDQYFSNPYRS